MDYSNLENERLVYYKKYISFLIIGLILAATGVILFILGLLSIGKLFLFQFLFMLMVFIGVVLMIVSGTINRKYSKTCRTKFIETLIEQNYGADCIFSQGEGIPLGAIMNTDFLRGRPDRVRKEDLMYGIYKGVKFRSSDVFIEEEHTYHDKNGSHTTYETLFKGRWYQFKTSVNQNCNIRVAEGKMAFNKKIYNKMEVESIEFNNKFSSWSTDEHTFYRIFTPSFIEGLMDLEKINSGKFMFSINCDTIDIAIYDSVDYFELTVTKKINDRTMELFNRQIRMPINMIEYLKLDNEKFLDKPFINNGFNTLDFDYVETVEPNKKEINKKQEENIINEINVDLDDINSFMNNNK